MEEWIIDGKTWTLCYDAELDLQFHAGYYWEDEDGTTTECFEGWDDAMTAARIGEIFQVKPPIAVQLINWALSKLPQ